MRRKIRIWLWRYRFVLATALLTLAAFAAVNEFRPAPVGHHITVALVELPAGSPIRSGDTGMRVFPTSPRGASADPVGLTPIVTIPAGLPITDSMLLGPGLSDHAPAGSVLAPIRVSDPSILTLIRVGDRVDLYMSHSDLGRGEPGAELISSGVQVIAIPRESSSGGALGLDGPEDALFYGAVQQSDASLFTGASGLAPFRVVITSS